MKRRLRDEEREQRITMEIVVDAYTPEEQAIGWYYSLERNRQELWIAGPA
jgi:Calcium binding